MLRGDTADRYTEELGTWARSRNWRNDLDGNRIYIFKDEEMMNNEEG